MAYAKFPPPGAAPLPTRRKALHWVGLGVLPGWNTSMAQELRPLRFVYNDTFAPFSYADNGALKGTLPRVIDELLGKRLRLDVTHQAFPWARAQTMVQRGDADGFVASATPERLEYTVASEEWLVQARLSAFVRRDNPRFAEYQKLQTVAELAPISLGSYLGNNWVQTTFPQRPVNYSTNRDTAMRMLLAGRFELLIDISLPARLAIQAAGLDATVQELPLVLDTDEVRLCISKKSPLVPRMGQIDEAIRAMKADGALSRLLRQ
nr:transporter substrate-binding domain-containing protein [uncultured Rhodoferax sp.]